MVRTKGRRLGVLMAAVVGALTLAAAPAYAHFCSKTGWSEAALAHAPKSQAWLSASEWLAFLAEVEAAGEICPAGAEVLRGQIAGQPANTLFLGPGLLAGGTLKNGKGNTPEHFSYLDIEAAFAACAA